MAPVGFEATILDHAATGIGMQYIHTVENTMRSWNPVVTPDVPSQCYISVLNTSDLANRSLFILLRPTGYVMHQQV
jgi:hypothetical protein